MAKCIILPLRRRSQQTKYLKCVCYVGATSGSWTDSYVNVYRRVGTKETFLQKYGPSSYGLSFPYGHIDWSNDYLNTYSNYPYWTSTPQGTSAPYQPSRRIANTYYSTGAVVTFYIVEP